ncbi:MAG: serine hydrolase [Synechococcales cyanobacterium CRU_2_2]|nr:serine hydrolase [Synechococcales cyanobacterium CRU_2_2]
MPFFRQDTDLTVLGDRILQATLAQFPGLARNQIALTWVVYDPGFPMNTGGAIAATDFWRHPSRGYSYRGVECLYPASIVKLFYAVALQEWVSKDMLEMTPEVERAARDMIVASSNDATGLIVDLLTGTTSGPELPPGPFETWKQQRNLVNRYFQALGWEELESCNINQKTWGDGPYGRERSFYGENYTNRNRLTTEAVARLVHSIAGGVAVSAAASQQLLGWMARTLDPADWKPDPENQIGGFIGEGLPAGAKCWSKAGWMSRVRHDAAYVELPGGLPYTVVVFVEGEEHADNEKLIPFVSSWVAQSVQEMTVQETS